MRLFLTALGLTLAAGAAPVAAQLAIIEWKTGNTSGANVETIICETCPPVAAPAEAVTEAPDVAPMQVELREVDGERLVYRTDAMMGGSPVTTVTSAIVAFGGDGSMPETQYAGPAGTGPDGIDRSIIAGGNAGPLTVDRSARTASVGGTVDVEDFELRLN